MTSEEYAAYHRDAVLACAEAHVSAKSRPADGALQRAVDEYAELLPEGVATPGHHLYTARNGDREIGMIWFAECPHGADRVAYLYDIKVEADRRGQGHGEAPCGSKCSAITQSPGRFIGSSATSRPMSSWPRFSTSKHRYVCHYGDPRVEKENTS